MSRNRSIYVTAEIEDILHPRVKGASRNISSTITTIIRRYSVLISEAIKHLDLTEQEWSLIFDSLNGTYLLENQERFILIQVADSIRLDGLDAKWGVNADVLLAKLDRLAVDYLHLIAIVDVTERFWSECGANNGNVDVSEFLASVGITYSPT